MRKTLILIIIFRNTCIEHIPEKYNKISIDINFPEYKFKYEFKR